jgi:ATP/ADP translocase
MTDNIMSKSKKVIKQQKNIPVSPFNIYWEKRNYFFLLLGIALLIIGFYLMSIGNWDNPIALIVSPIILIIGYFLIFPLAIFYSKKQSNKNT